jgi:hypothetical protein
MGKCNDCSAPLRVPGFGAKHVRPPHAAARITYCIYYESRSRRFRRRSSRLPWQLPPPDTKIDTQAPCPHVRRARTSEMVATPAPVSVLTRARRQLGGQASSPPPYATCGRTAGGSCRRAPAPCRGGAARRTRHRHAVKRVAAGQRLESDQRKRAELRRRPDRDRVAPLRGRYASTSVLFQQRPSRDNLFNASLPFV